MHEVSTFRAERRVAFAAIPVARWRLFAFVGRMKTIRLLALLAIPLTLCFTVSRAADNATPPVSSATSGYDLGFAKGQKDGRGGLSRTPDRYESLYSQADRAEFFRGYEAGYNQGIKVPASKSYGEPLTAVKRKGRSRSRRAAARWRSVPRPLPMSRRPSLSQSSRRLS